MALTVTDRGKLMAAFDLRTIHQTSEGWDLLNDMLVEHERLLWELETEVKESQIDANSEVANRVNLVKTQILLFERLMIGQRADSLAALVKHYAEIISRPHGGITETAV
jgi:hypothetical protein